MGTKVSAATPVLPWALTTEDYAPVQRANGTKARVDQSLLQRSIGLTFVAGNATGNATTDTAAIQAALTGLAEGAVLVIPAGNWAVRELTYSGVGLCEIIGVGRDATTLTFAPTANNQTALTVDHSAPMYNIRISNMTIRTTDTGYNKTGLKLVDVAEATLEDVSIIGFGGTGKDAVCLHTKGRESLWCRNVYFGGNIPLRIGVNPNTAEPDNGSLSADHFTFENCVFDGVNYSTTDALVKACVLIDSNAQVSQLQFLGSQAWLQGAGHGLYWNQSAGTYSTYSSGLRIENLRNEQATVATTWAVYLNHAGSSGYHLRNLSLKNCELNENNEGLFTDYVETISIEDTLLTQATGRKLVDADHFISLAFRNVRSLYGTGAAGSVNVHGITKQWSVPQTATYDHPYTAVWGT